jgi:hypothetical protein
MLEREKKIREETCGREGERKKSFFFFFLSKSKKYYFNDIGNG